MPQVSVRYRRLRDPDAVVIWDSPDYAFDHLVVVWPRPLGSMRGRILISEMIGWCIEQYDKRGPARRGRTWNYKTNAFDFQTEVQALSFVFRWRGVEV